MSVYTYILCVCIFTHMYLCECECVCVRVCQTAPVPFRQLHSQGLSPLCLSNGSDPVRCRWRLASPRPTCCLCRSYLLPPPSLWRTVWPEDGHNQDMSPSTLKTCQLACSFHVPGSNPAADWLAEELQVWNISTWTHLVILLDISHYCEKVIFDHLFLIKCLHPK